MTYTILAVACAACVLVITYQVAWLQGASYGRRDTMEAAAFVGCGRWEGDAAGRPNFEWTDVHSLHRKVDEWRREYDTLRRAHEELTKGYDWRKEDVKKLQEESERVGRAKEISEQSVALLAEQRSALLATLQDLAIEREAIGGILEVGLAITRSQRSHVESQRSPGEGQRSHVGSQRSPGDGP